MAMADVRRWAHRLELGERRHPRVAREPLGQIGSVHWTRVKAELGRQRRSHRVRADHFAEDRALAAGADGVRSERDLELPRGIGSCRAPSKPRVLTRQSALGRVPIRVAESHLADRPAAARLDRHAKFVGSAARFELALDLDGAPRRCHPRGAASSNTERASARLG